MNLQRLLAQAQAINPLVTDVRYDQWYGQDGPAEKYWAFTNDESFAGETAEKMLVNLLQETKIQEAA